MNREIDMKLKLQMNLELKEYKQNYYFYIYISFLPSPKSTCHFSSQPVWRKKILEIRPEFQKRTQVTLYQYGQPISGRLNHDGQWPY